MLIGRHEEQKKLKDAYASEYSEFVAVYGRRRVGKTFLIRETFDYKFTFTHSGVANMNTRGQLSEFHASLKRQGASKKAIPANWSKAFAQLAEFLEQSTDKRKTIFIDEMPWMDASRSGFVSALEHFWNGWASARKDIMLIVCGSASSWIINKILKNHGGLHNRVSTKIHLKPFTLHECELYAAHRRIRANRLQIVEAYMAMGGIPYYWSKLDRSKSIAQNIDSLFFSPDGEFRHEFDDLYASLFNKPEKYLRIIDTLGKKKIGLTRESIVKYSRLEDNGQLSRMLEDLVYCGFIRKYCNIGKKVKNSIYQLVDNYTLFYYRFIKDFNDSDENTWMKLTGKPEYNTWCGLAFERLCLLHVRQIKAALGISGITANVHSWYIPSTPERKGAQIDLLIDRADNVVDICEMKYAKTKYTITRPYYDNLSNKMARFIESESSKKAVRMVMVTSNGLAVNKYSGIVDHELTVDTLFTE